MTDTTNCVQENTRSFNVHIKPLPLLLFTTVHFVLKMSVLIINQLHS